METPLLISLARQVLVHKQMGVIASNMANVSTPAYKGERLLFTEHLSAPKGGKAVSLPQSGGVHRDYRVGPIHETFNSLDLAIKGDGFFEVETPQGTRYTRNGHFQLDSKGQLVTGEGNPVLNIRSRPITFALDAKNIVVSKDGSVSDSNGAVGQLNIVGFENHEGLKRAGSSLFMAAIEGKRVNDPEVVQGKLEQSNVKPILEMTRMIELLRKYQSAQKMIQKEDERQREAIRKLAQSPQT